VVINDSANATLAVGASPIMATNPRDCKDLSPVIGALLVNFGWVPLYLAIGHSSIDD